MIAILDYGVGNVGSIESMLHHVGRLDVAVTSKAADVARADGIILPGVGSFGPAIEKLRASGLVGVLTERVIGSKVPLLGVCLGMQMLAGGSEEGAGAGLGWIAGRALRFPDQPGLRVPHMGWNDVAFRPGRRLGQGLNGSRFYFAHSYHVVCDRTDDVAATTVHGNEVTAAVENGNVFGVQFHPEKSHQFGMRLYENFADLVDG